MNIGSYAVIVYHFDDLSLLILLAALTICSVFYASAVTA